VNEWELAAAVLGAALLGCVCLAALTTVATALVALELAGTIATTILMVLSEGLQRQPFIDLAVVLAVVSVLGCMVIARLLEEDL
jgi:multisubunit Na+/H+ antiporter MnhF subunit